MLAQTPRSPTGRPHERIVARACQPRSTADGHKVIRTGYPACGIEVRRRRHVKDVSTVAATAAYVWIYKRIHACISPLDLKTPRKKDPPPTTHRLVLCSPRSIMRIISCRSISQQYNARRHTPTSCLICRLTPFESVGDLSHEHTIQRHTRVRQPRTCPRTYLFALDRRCPRTGCLPTKSRARRGGSGPRKRAYLRPPAAVRRCAHACARIKSGTLSSLQVFMLIAQKPPCPSEKQHTQHGVCKETHEGRHFSAKRVLSLAVHVHFVDGGIGNRPLLQRTCGDRCFGGRGSCRGFPTRCPVDPSSTPALMLVPPMSSPTKSMLSSNIAATTYFSTGMQKGFSYTQLDNAGEPQLYKGWAPARTGSVTVGFLRPRKSLSSSKTHEG